MIELSQRWKLVILISVGKRPMAAIEYGRRVASSPKVNINSINAAIHTRLTTVTTSVRVATAFCHHNIYQPDHSLSLALASGTEVASLVTSVEPLRRQENIVSR